MAAAAKMGRVIYSVKVLPVGINAAIMENDLRDVKSTIIYAAGPVANILLSLGGLLANTYCLQQSNDMLFFISSNLYLAAFNLLPIIPMDGGMILREVLWGHVGLFSARKYLKRINRVLAFVLVIFGMIQLVNSTWNFSLIIMGVYVFFAFGEGGIEMSLMNVKSIIYRRARLLKKGIYQARDLVVIKSLHMSEVLKHMDFDRFHIIYVLDDELNILKVMTEQEVIDSLLKHNVEMTFEEYLNLEKPRN